MPCSTRSCCIHQQDQVFPMAVRVDCTELTELREVTPGGLRFPLTTLNRHDKFCRTLVNIYTCLPKCTEHCASQLHLHHSRLRPLQNAPFVSHWKREGLVPACVLMSNTRASSPREADTAQSHGLLCTNIQDRVYIRQKSNLTNSPTDITYDTIHKF